MDCHRVESGKAAPPQAVGRVKPHPTFLEEGCRRLFLKQTGQGLVQIRQVGAGADGCLRSLFVALGAAGFIEECNPGLGGWCRLTAHIVDQVFQGIDFLNHQIAVDIGDVGGDDQILLFGHVARNQSLDFIGNYLGLERCFLSAEMREQDQVILLIDLVLHICRIEFPAEDALDQAVNMFAPLRPAGAQHFTHVLQANQL